MKNSRATFGHRSLVLNEHYTASNPPQTDRTKVQDTIVVDQLVYRPQFRDLRDPLHLAQGGVAGRVHKGMLAIILSGRILVPDATQVAMLEDRERQLRLSFDPYECYRDSPETDGLYALSWYEPTTDTVYYPTGWMAVTRYVRPAGQPETVWAMTDAANRKWVVPLVAPDPRLYETLGGSATVTSPFAATNLTNNGPIPGPLRVTITMAAAGASNFTITRAGVSFVLNLSTLSPGGVVVVTMETSGPFGIGRRITKNGVDAFSLKTSGPTTWLDVPSGATAFTHAHTDYVQSILYEWGHARP